MLWHNGWSLEFDVEDCPGGFGCPTIFNHNAYITSRTTNTSFVRNITADGASHGCQQRRGGINDNNLYLRNANGLNWGHGNCDWDSQTPSNGQVATGSVTRNVFLDGRDILVGTLDPNDEVLRAHGMWVLKTIDSVISRNLFAHQVTGSSGRVITFQGNMINVTLEDNKVYRWVSNTEEVHTLHVSCDLPTWENILIQNNEFQQVVDTLLVEHRPSLAEFTYSANIYHPTTGTPFKLSGTCGSLADKSFSQWVSEVESNAVSQEVNYSDPSRDIGRYLDEVAGITPGPDPITEFMLEAIQQSRTNWRPEFTAPRVNCYMRAGFDMSDPCYDLDSDNSGGVSDLLILLGAW